MVKIPIFKIKIIKKVKGFIIMQMGINTVGIGKMISR